jgi:hypothetical protein
MTFAPDGGILASQETSLLPHPFKKKSLAPLLRIVLVIALCGSALNNALSTF